MGFSKHIGEHKAWTTYCASCCTEDTTGLLPLRSKRIEELQAFGKAQGKVRWQPSHSLCYSQGNVALRADIALFVYSRKLLRAWEQSETNHGDAI